MEQNFETSFIPKKPVIQKTEGIKRPVGILTIVSFFLFFTLILALGGVYFYKKNLSKNIEKMAGDLKLAEDRFEPAKINQLKTLDRRIRASKDILDKHIAISPIFGVLSRVTMKEVRYTDFSYELGGGDTNGSSQGILIKLSGISKGYRYVALQSDLYNEEENLVDPVFSNLALDEKGNVLFELEFLVEPSFVDYRQTLETGSNVPNTPPLDTSI